MKKRLEDIIRELYQISGFRICIYDIEGQEVCAWPKEISALCQLIQRNPEGLAACKKNDEKAFKHVRDTGEALLYQCHAGLYEGMAPLYDSEKLSGFLMMGQALDDMSQSEQEVLFRVGQYTSDKVQLQQVIEQIPKGKKSQIAACMSILDVCAAYITLSDKFKTADTDLPHKVKKYIILNYKENISLDELSRLFGCSRGVLTASFRQRYQTSIHQFLIEYRLEKSCKLLADKSILIGEVASKVGIPDQNYFTKAFKKRYGVSPSVYRKM